MAGQRADGPLERRHRFVQFDPRGLWAEERVGASDGAGEPRRPPLSGQSIRQSGLRHLRRVDGRGRRAHRRPSIDVI